MLMSCWMRLNAAVMSVWDAMNCVAIHQRHQDGWLLDAKWEQTHRSQNPKNEHDPIQRPAVRPRDRRIEQIRDRILAVDDQPGALSEIREHHRGVDDEAERQL